MTQWWNQPGDKFVAYYFNLRINYEMPALEAFLEAKKQFALYPEFFSNPIEVLRTIIGKDRTQ